MSEFIYVDRVKISFILVLDNVHKIREIDLRLQKETEEKVEVEN